MVVKLVLIVLLLWSISESERCAILVRKQPRVLGLVSSKMKGKVIGL